MKWQIASGILIAAVVVQIFRVGWSVAYDTNEGFFTRACGWGATAVSLIAGAIIMAI